MVQTFAANRTDQSLHKGILPWGSRRSKHFLHSHISSHGDEISSADGISIAQYISRRLVPGERFPHLLQGPLLRGVFRHPEVHHPASLMREHNENEQDPEGRRRHGFAMNKRGAFCRATTDCYAVFADIRRIV